MFESDIVQFFKNAHKFKIPHGSVPVPALFLC